MTGTSAADTSNQPGMPLIFLNAWPFSGDKDWRPNRQSLKPLLSPCLRSPSFDEFPDQHASASRTAIPDRRHGLHTHELAFIPPAKRQDFESWAPARP